MADQPAPNGAAAGTPNLQNSPGAVVRNQPHPGEVAARRARAGRAETAALLERGQLGNAKPSVAAKPPAPEVDPDDGGQAQSGPEDLPPDGQGDTDEGGRPALPDPDPETSRRIAKLEAKERQQRTQAQAVRADLERQKKEMDDERTQWAPRIKAAEDFEQLKLKARRGGAHLVEVFRALGFSDADFSPAGQTLYAASPEAGADPARKANAERLWRERGAIADSDATSKRLDDLERKIEERERALEQREQQSRTDEAAARYIGASLEEATEEHPIVQAIVAKAANGKTKEERLAGARAVKSLRAKLWTIAQEMAEEDGEYPEASALLKRYEDIRGAELDEIGIPRPNANAKKNSQPADKTTPARTLSAELSTPRVPQSGTTGKDHRAETRRLIEAGKMT